MASATKAGANAKRRRPVGSGDNHNGPRQAFGAQLVLQKFAHFAVALADQGDHVDIGGAMPRHRAEQRALADAAAAENADALALAAGQQTVDGANARGQPFFDVFAFQRARRPALSS